MWEGGTRRGGWEKEWDKDGRLRGLNWSTFQYWQQSTDRCHQTSKERSVYLSICPSICLSVCLSTIFSRKWQLCINITSKLQGTAGNSSSLSASSDDSTQTSLPHCEKVLGSSLPAGSGSSLWITAPPSHSTGLNRCLFHAKRNFRLFEVQEKVSVSLLV